MPDPFFDNDLEETEPIPTLSAAERDARRIAFVRALSVIVRGGNAEAIGKRALILAHALRVRSVRTQRELAQRLGVSPARVSRQLKRLSRQLSESLGGR